MDPTHNWMRRGTMAIMWLLALAMLLEAWRGSWYLFAAIGFMLGVNIVVFIQLHKLEERLLAIEAHHDWLRWKAHQQ